MQLHLFHAKRALEGTCGDINKLDAAIGNNREGVPQFSLGDQQLIGGFQSSQSLDLLRDQPQLPDKNDGNYDHTGVKPRRHKNSKHPKHNRADQQPWNAGEVPGRGQFW